MRKFEKIWIGSFAIAVVGVLCAVVCAVYKYDIAIAPSIMIAGIASYVGIGAMLICEKRKSLGQY